MKIFIYFILITGLIQMNAVSADPVFLEMPMSAVAKKHLLMSLGDKIHQNNKILFIRLDSASDGMMEEQLTHKNKFSVIAAYNPSLTKLKQIEEALESGGTAYIVYFPKESFHWQLLEQTLGKDSSSDIATYKEYQQAIKSLDVSLVQATLYRDFAIYQNKEELIAEINKDPLLWQPRIHRKALTALVELAQQRSMLYSENEKIIIPYKMLNIILIKN